MRWIDLHPSIDAPETSAVAERTRLTDAEVRGAAERAHRAALDAAAQAHRAAAGTWSRPTPNSAASPLHARHGAAHLDRAETLTGSDSASRLGPMHPEPPTQAWAQALSASAELDAPEAGISRPPLDLRIGLVSGERLHSGFFGLARLRDITAQNWQTELAGLDLLVIGSEALEPSQQQPTAERSSFLLKTLIPAARAAGVATALVVTSGPGISSALPVARRCAHVFATDPEAAAVLRSRCPEEISVEVIPHPVSPLLHTPLGTRPARSPLIALLGTEQHGPAPHLGEPQFVPPLFDGVLGSGRPAAFLPPDQPQPPEQPQQPIQPEPQPATAATTPRTHPPRWGIPADYAPWTPTRAEAEPLESAEQRARMQRVLDMGLAVNTVMDSQSVFDPQVLQLQACGTMVFSTYNQGVNSYYPQVHIANSAEDVAKTLELTTLEELRRAQADGIRRIFTDHHGSDVLHRICRTAGLAVQEHQDRVLVVADELAPRLRTDLESQTHPSVEITTWAELAEAHARHGRDGSVTAGVDVLVPVSSRRRYSPEYVADHVAAFRYQGAPVTTKLDGDASSTDGQAHQRRADVADLALSAWWRPDPALDSPETLLAALRRRSEGAASSDGLDSGLPVYGIDHLGHGRAEDRNPLDRTRGTDIAAAREEFRSTAEALGLELAVVVPIYNNGDHLRHKAFASLRRSRIFEKMHILLINDGSTDASTVDTIEELAHTWPNVSAFHHPLGGSGSASRPRNTGLQLSFTEFVTYLDPDDEELEDGYWELLDRLRGAPQADYALGTMAVWTRRFGVHDYHEWFLHGVEHRDGLHWPRPDSLVRLNFRPASIEALVARTAWLKGLGLVQPEGAVGQDSYFFQQMFFYTRAYVPVYRPVYTYYGAVETSIVNVISPNYFRKYLILERDRADWLRRVGLFDIYLQQRFESFFVTWYLEKFKRVLPQDREEAAGVLREIIAAYGDVRWKDPRGIDFFRSAQGRS